jgi:hypothetical protein
MSRTNRALMITDTNQAYFAKMSNRGVQEEVNRVEGHVMSETRWGTTKGVRLS